MNYAVIPVLFIIQQITVIICWIKNQQVQGKILKNFKTQHSHLHITFGYYIVPRVGLALRHPICPVAYHLPPASVYYVILVFELYMHKILHIRIIHVTEQQSEVIQKSFRNDSKTMKQNTHFYNPIQLVYKEKECKLQNMIYNIWEKMQQSPNRYQDTQDTELN